MVFTAIGEASGLVATSASGVLHEHDCGPLKLPVERMLCQILRPDSANRCLGEGARLGLSPFERASAAVSQSRGPNHVTDVRRSLVRLLAPRTLPQLQ